jgi:hypothetical protein
MMRRMCIGLVLFCSVFALIHLAAPVQASAQAADTKGTFLLTIFLRHDQSKTLEDINKHLESTGFWKEFPPPGIEVVSWYVMMGIGQVVTLRVPAEKLREVNVAIEKRAWGAFSTEFYATYDFRPVWEANFKKK